MRISLNWLQELVDITLAPEALARLLTIAGFEVEDIEDRRTWAEGVVVGRVLERQPHPNADKLSVCQVDLGGATPVNIVCGAANVRADILVPVATPGAYLPVIDLKIKPSKLRGVRSEGMICSLAEVGLAKESAGIHIFGDEGLTLGQPVGPLLGLDDVILDVTATANRADALSMVGIAREVAALTGATLQLPEVTPPSVPTQGMEIALAIADGQTCPAYQGTLLEGITIAPSPAWLQARLQGAGVRPINNVVDITNLVLLEWGQPLHAFDADRLGQIAGGSAFTVGVRLAQGGETLKTLDGQDRRLTPENLVITAGDRPVALAGVMGGEESEVHDGTRRVFLEVALFNNVAIRRSARTQALRTEASTRYERGVNQVALETAAHRAIALLQTLAGATLQGQTLVDQRPDLSQRPPITLRLQRLHELLGQVQEGDGWIPAAEVERILGDLNCTLTVASDSPHIWSVTVPPYRHRDLEREVDLIEEVARLYGYDRFVDTLPRKTEPGYLSTEEKVRRQLREAFRGVGLTELVHYSLVKPEQADVVLSNPLFSEYSALRKDLLPGLIDAFVYNLDQGNGPLQGFEMGRIFWTEDDRLEEADAIAGIFGGSFHSQGLWVNGGKPTPLGWYEAKGLLETALQRLGLRVTYQADSSDSRFHPGRTALLWLGKEILGRFGQLHPRLRRERDLPDEVYAFTLDFPLLVKVLADRQRETPHFQPYPVHPASDRDLAFYAPIKITVDQVTQTMLKAGQPLLRQVDLFDEYQGSAMGEEQRSLAFRLQYRAEDRTLTDEDVEPLHQKVRDRLVETFGVTLRS